MKIKDILKKQGEIYKNLTSNKTIQEYNETVKPKLVPYKGHKIWDYECKAIKELEKLLGREPNIGNLGYHFGMEIRDHKVINLHIRGLNLTEIPKQINNLPNLQTLDLSINQISEIKNLDNLINLEGLYLSCNQISKVENLDKLKHLKKVYLPENPMINKKEIKKLRKRKVDVIM